KIKARFTSPSDQKTMFTTLPYSEKAVVKVDGKKVDTYAHLGAFLGFDLPSAGEHEVTISLKGESDKPYGAALRPVGLTLLLGVCGYDVFLHAKRKKEEETGNA
ncbi:MAG: YfhO family protein, partial [Clostridia bacterium]|nr:YfhO family protein [Clostridia bacterium]